MERTVQEVFRIGFAAYEAYHPLPASIRSAAWNFIHCRTAALGGHIQACPEGHVERVWYNSCKHRACPQCNQIQIERWLEFQQARLLDCAHHHIIFTLPHELNGLWVLNRTVMTQLFFQAVRDTLLELTEDARYLGAQPGLLCALHTWGRSLALHPHIHCLITDGGLDSEGHWQRPKKSCFLPARVVMALFRGKFLAAVRQALEAEQLRLPETAPRLLNLLNKLGRKQWNVHLRERYPHGEGVVKYLARYVRGGPLKNTQICQVTDTQVTYRYSAHEDHPEGGKRRVTELTLTHAEFIRRYSQHIPEPRRQLIRRYGLYAHTQGERLTQARAQWGQPPLQRPAFLDWQSYYLQVTGHREATVCPVCGQPLQAQERVARRAHDPPS